MILNNSSYGLIKEFKGEGLNTLALPIIDKPKDVYSFSKNIDGVDMVTPNSTAFINTSDITKVGSFFEKNGVYTRLDPIYDKYEYQAFWDEETKKRKNGVTIPGELYYNKEDGNYNLRQVHITGEHYGYLNYARIKRVPDEVLAEDFGSNAQLESLQEQVGTIAATKEISFPDFWDGDYYYFHAVKLAKIVGKHLVVGKARRKGYSYKNGWICANRADLYPNTVTGIAAYDADSLYPKGTFSMADDYLQWIFEHTDWKKRRLRDSKEGFIKFGYRYKNSPSVERGFKSVIIAVPFGPAQPGALRGKDADLIIVEEAGKARNLADFLESTLPTLKAGRFITGLMIIFGTGGGDETFWETFEDIFYDPDTSDFMVFSNLFDKDSDEEGCGFFMPDFVNKEGFMDSEGNSNTIEAARYEIEIRQKLKEKGKLDKLRKRSMEYCFTPSEAFSRGSGNMFNEQLISEQLARVRKDPLLKNIGRAGILKYKDGGVIFKDARFLDETEMLNFHPPVTDTRLKPGKDNHGCFIQYQAPYKVDGKIPSNLYRIWHDPFGVDKERSKQTAKHSFGCIYVYERINNITPTGGMRIVGVFIGRPERTDDVNEMLYMLSDYYNAQVLYEKNVSTVYPYFKEKRALDRLVNTPQGIFDKDSNSLDKNPDKGIHINEDRKITGAMYLKDLLEKKMDMDNNGKWKLFIHYIYDIPTLQELLKWNIKGNFDRISTLIVGMFDIKSNVFVEVQAPRQELDADSFFNRELF